MSINVVLIGYLYNSGILDRCMHRVQTKGEV